MAHSCPLHTILRILPVPLAEEALGRGEEVPLKLLQEFFVDVLPRAAVMRKNNINMRK